MIRHGAPGQTRDLIDRLEAHALVEQPGPPIASVGVRRAQRFDLRLRHSQCSTIQSRTTREAISAAGRPAEDLAAPRLRATAGSPMAGLAAWGETSHRGFVRHGLSEPCPAA